MGRRTSFRAPRSAGSRGDRTDRHRQPFTRLGSVHAASSAFPKFDEERKKASLAALAAVDNPMTHSAETVACVACHTSTVLMFTKAPLAGVDPMTLPGRYSSKFDISVDGGKSQATGRTLRALGYLGKDPMIAQRVANDTAQTLTEIEARFPSPK